MKKERTTHCVVVVLAGCTHDSFDTRIAILVGLGHDPDSAEFRTLSKCRPGYR